MRNHGILIDGSNVHETAKRLGWQIDYAKLLRMFEGNIVRAMYFTALPPKHVETPLRRLTDHLEFNGYTLIQKETKEWANDDGSMKTKGNMDVELCIHGVEICPFITDLHLFSGDGDFRALVEYAQRRFGIRVSVYSSIHQDAMMCADELRRQADVFVNLTSIRAKIEMTNDDPVKPRFQFSRKNNG